MEFYKKNAISEPAVLDPLQHPDYFQVSNMFTVRDLFNKRVHYGHKEGSMNDKMSPFIYGSRLGHLIFDLDQTAELLRQALNFTAHIAYNDGVILLLSRDPQTAHLVDKLAIDIGEYSHTRKWDGDIFTNTEKTFGCVARLPDLCIFFNSFEKDMTQHEGIITSAKMCIPTVAIVDSNADPDLVTYPVPGNDDSILTVKYYMALFKEAIMRGKNARRKLLEQQSVQ